VGRRLSPAHTAGVYFLLALYYGFFLLPMAWIVVTSFKSTSAIFSARLIPRLSDLTFTGYQQVWQFSPFLTFFRNSTITALGVTLLALGIASPGAFGLSKYPARGRRGLVISILTSQMLPPVLILVPFYTMVVAWGLSDTYAGIVLAHTVLALPFCIWMLKSYMDAVPSVLVEAAQVDGCTKLGTFLRIMLPAATPGLAVAAFFAFTVSWGDYLFVSLVSGSNRTATLPLYLYQLSSSLQLRWDMIAAGTVLTVLPVVILFALVQRWLVEGLLAGAVKG
jgi:ABC-type glycerol-3-phosphate transport system permease component